MSAASQLLIVVAAALVAPDGRVLVQQRAADRAMAGLWEFPGGKLESGETPEQALARELEEELGVTVEPSAFSSAAFASELLGERHMLLLLFTATEWQGEPAALDASAIRWVTVDDMRVLEMPPADVPLVEALAGLLPLPA